FPSPFSRFHDYPGGRDPQAPSAGDLRGRTQGVRGAGGKWRLLNKQRAVLHELVPKTIRFAVLVNPANGAGAETRLRDVQEAAQASGLQIQVLNVSTTGEMDAPFAPLGHGGRGWWEASQPILVGCWPQKLKMGAC